MKTKWITSALCALMVAACSKAPPQADPVRAVKTMVVGAGAPASARERAAEVRARTDSPLGFQVGGRLIKRQAQLGDTVKAGQVLAQLDARDLELGSAAAQAQLMSAQTQFDQARSDYQRYAELQDKGFISTAELERRRVSLQAAQAQRDQARAQAGVQGHQAGYATLTAAAAGVVTAVYAEPGQVLASGAPVLRLAHDGPRDAVFNVAEQDEPALRKLLGQRGAVQVRLWGDESQLHAATVREVAGAADAVTRTFLVKADLGGLAVRPGQTATVLLPADGAIAPGALRVPLAAVTEQQGRSMVWVLDAKTMTVQPRPVKLAGGEGGDAVIASGLTAGDEVVTAGVHVLTAGQTVRRYTGAP